MYRRVCVCVCVCVYIYSYIFTTVRIDAMKKLREKKDVATFCNRKQLYEDSGGRRQFQLVSTDFR